MKQVLLLAAAVLVLGFTAASAISDETHPAKAAAQQSYTVKGVVVAVNQAAGKLKLKHEAVPELQWPGMTMDFPVADKSVLTGIKPGQKVEFQFDMTSGSPRVTRVTAVK